jgi:hypothetical protein
MPSKMTEKDGRRPNIFFAKGRVMGFYDSFVTNSSSVFQLNNYAENSPLNKTENLKNQFTTSGTFIENQEPNIKSPEAHKPLYIISFRRRKTICANFFDTYSQTQDGVFVFAQLMMFCGRNRNSSILEYT